jgi:hypothetical protein
MWRAVFGVNPGQDARKQPIARSCENYPRCVEHIAAEASENRNDHAKEQQLAAPTAENGRGDCSQRRDGIAGQCRTQGALRYQLQGDIQE